ncbi:SDR family oxidoreductase [Streptomyces sp. NPDC006267]|uniref:SDR family oxidoreductase n=1 Tax=Streptomyces sp. NPDC006267 TaxID=3157173 RepID=UPI0033B67454
MARGLAQDGWRLVLNGRDTTRLKRCRGGHPRRGIPGGSHSRGSRPPAGRLRPQPGRPGNVLVTGAGIGWAGQVSDMTGSAVNEIVHVDLLSTVRLVRHLLLYMVGAGSGRVVLIGSVAGVLDVRSEAVYSAAKAALAAVADVCDTNCTASA